VDRRNGESLFVSRGDDGGTTLRIFGGFLSWLQDKKSPVFVVGTANNIDQLPPELLRRGRLDEIFFVDLPSEAERQAIFEFTCASADATRKPLPLILWCRPVTSTREPKLKAPSSPPCMTRFMVGAMSRGGYRAQPRSRWCRFPKPCMKRSRDCATGPQRERVQPPKS
jgi:hypothetical protein